MRPYTQGPWRWELNELHKYVHLVGGVPPFQRVVMGFKPYGESSGEPLFSTQAGKSTGAMRPSTFFGVAILGHELETDWLKDINHVDAQLIMDAPLMLELLRDLVDSHSPDEIMDNRVLWSAHTLLKKYQEPE